MVRHVQAVVRPPPTRHRTECRSEEGIGCGLKFPRKSIVGLCGQCNLIESLYLNGGDSDDDEDMARQDNLIRKVEQCKSCGLLNFSGDPLNADKKCKQCVSDGQEEFDRNLNLWDYEDLKAADRAYEIITREPVHKPETRNGNTGKDESLVGYAE
ncbi:hypothetical protein E1B28_000389 [Marasmius oreades]|uniref:Uncharacterized protein n=1 Tax=Marasmius oreades TaxID=181124 RepID=A0A9P7V169_9AGAR|nr:uncharacterized protein E1B28_000389 [Marasmius oreades]KAG7098438.1 hypothetical protein E1B28_000389 [Marasmius oreades]